jgi:hypothetical protein
LLTTLQKTIKTLGDIDPLLDRSKIIPIELCPSFDELL